MTSDEYATLMDFLATRFARMDARMEAMEARMGAMEARMEAMEARMGAMEARMEGMEARMGAMEARMGTMEARTGATDVRLTRAEVLGESMRDDIRRLADGLVALNERLDAGLSGIQVRFDRFAVDFGTVQLDHGARIEALERHRRRSHPEG